MPGVAGLALALVFAGIVSIALAGRGLSVWRLAASTVVSQLAFHVVFSTLGGAGEVVAGTHHGQVVLNGAESVAHASTGMWIAHGVAAVTTIVALCFGERALFGLRQTGWMLVSALFSPTVVASIPLDRAPQPRVEPRALPRLALRSLDAVGTRGPPLALRSA